MDWDEAESVGAILEAIGNHFSDGVQLVSTIAAAAAAYFSYKQGKRQIDGDRYLRVNEKSVELARLFASDVVPKSSYINAIVSCSSSFNELAKKVSRAEIRSFTSEEYEHLIGETPQETLEKIRREFGEDKCFHKLMNVRNQFVLMSPDDAFNIHLPIIRSTDDEGTGEPRRHVDQKASADFAYVEFCTLANTLLNCLEHFCMALNSGVADGDILYPSLHQVFSSVVAELYLFICSNNHATVPDQFYTHTIDVYRKWSERHDNEEKEEEERLNRRNRSYKAKKEGQLR